MQFKVFLEDLNDDVISRIKWVLRHDLAEEVDEFASRFDLNREDVEDQIIHDYLNRHNTGFEIEL